MFAFKKRNISHWRRTGFTLVELLMVMLLIGIMASFVLVALANVTQTAKEDRTKAQIKKIHELIMEQWESYRYKPVPPTTAMGRIRLYGGGGQHIPNKRIALERLKAIRELMRMEMPTFISDVQSPARHIKDSLDVPRFGRAHVPALWRAYRQRMSDTWTKDHEQAECLYLILSQIRDADSSALEFFKENEIGDVDGDGMREILDAWGNPIQWMLWAPGYTSPLQVPYAQNPQQDDPFDPSTLGSAYQDRSFTGSYSGDGFQIDFSLLPRTLYPLIYSAGPDGKHGIVLHTVSNSNEADQNWVNAANDPYNRNPNLKMFLLGATSVKQPEAMADDISNHYLTTR